MQTNRSESSSRAAIAMMQPANLRNSDDLATVWRLDFARDRRVAAKRKVRPRLVIIGQVIGENPPQMALVEHDDLI